MLSPNVASTQTSKILFSFDIYSALMEAYLASYSTANLCKSMN